MPWEHTNFVIGTFQYVLGFILLTLWAPGRGDCKIHARQFFLQLPEAKKAIPVFYLYFLKFLYSFYFEVGFFFFLTEILFSFNSVWSVWCSIVKIFREWILYYFFPGISHQLDVEIDWKLKELRENSSTQPKADLPMEIRVATEYEKKSN